LQSELAKEKTVHPIAFCFNLYVENPKEMWGDIKMAESYGDKGNSMFYEMASKYQMYRFGRSSFSSVLKSQKNINNLVESRS